MTDAEIIELAWAEAAETPGYAYGTVITKDGEVIASDHHHVDEIPDTTAHAEVSALRKANEKLQTFKLHGCTLWSTYEPCPMCTAACAWAGIEEIVYAKPMTDDPSPHMISGLSTSEVIKALGLKLRVRQYVVADKNR